MPDQVLGEWILWFNGPDKIVQSGKYFSSIRVAFVDENKYSHRKITIHLII